MSLLLCLLIAIAAVFFHSTYGAQLSDDSEDIVPRMLVVNCVKTNYENDPIEFYSSPNGITWDYQIATFGFDWPEHSMPDKALSYATNVDRVQFTASNNLAYFRVVFTLQTGESVTTDPIYPQQTDTDLPNVVNVTRVDFYLAPKDFRCNVTVYDLNFRLCAKDSKFGSIGVCTMFDLFDHVSSADSLVGVSRSKQTDGFTVSLTPDYPYIELDLACAALGNVNFTQMIFEQATNFDTVVVNIWNDDADVPVIRKDGVENNRFETADDIYFESGVTGNRIRATIIPRSPIENQGITGSIGFSKYSVYINGTLN